MARTYKVIDADGHILGPSTSGTDTWTRRTASMPLA